MALKSAGIFYNTMNDKTTTLTRVGGLDLTVSCSFLSRFPLENLFLRELLL